MSSRKKRLTLLDLERDPERLRAEISEAVRSVAEAVVGMEWPTKEKDRDLLITWSKHPELGELTAGAASDAINTLRSTTSSNAGAQGAETKKAQKQIKENQAIQHFRRLIASGDRDADDAIRAMIDDGWKRATLYRYLADELQKLGRGRKSVKREVPRK